jgi:hypothetical protein
VPSVSDITREPVWKFLTTTDELELFAKIKVGYQALFRQLLPPVDVVTAAADNTSTTMAIAERALAGLLRVDPPASAGLPGIPRFVLGPAAAPVNALVGSLTNEGLQGIGLGHVRTMPVLDHAVVFYEEKAHINPGSMLVVAPTLAEHFENPVLDAAGRQAVLPAVWKQQRMAYNIEGRSRVATAGFRRDMGKNSLRGMGGRPAALA